MMPLGRGVRVALPPLRRRAPGFNVVEGRVLGRTFEAGRGADGVVEGLRRSSERFPVFQTAAHDQQLVDGAHLGVDDAAELDAHLRLALLQVGEDLRVRRSDERPSRRFRSDRSFATTRGRDHPTPRHLEEGDESRRRRRRARPLAPARCTCGRPNSARRRPFSMTFGGVGMLVPSCRRPWTARTNGLRCRSAGARRRPFERPRAPPPAAGPGSPA